MRILVLKLLLIWSPVLLGTPLEEELCLGQCSEIDFDHTFTDTEGNELRLQFDENGFFVITAPDGTVTVAPYQEAINLKNYVIDQIYYGQMDWESDNSLMNSGDRQIANFFSALNFVSPRTPKRMQQQRILNERQRTYCLGPSPHESVVDHCNSFVTHFEGEQQAIDERMLLLNSRLRNCLGRPPSSSNVRNVFNILSSAMEADGMDMNDSYCNSAVGLLAPMLNQLGLVQGSDYKITNGEGHVFVELTSGDQIIDPTYLQFVDRSCEAFTSNESSPGFYGTRDELKNFFISNRSCFRALTTSVQAELDAAGTDEQWWEIVENRYYGHNHNFNSAVGDAARSSMEEYEMELAEGSTAGDGSFATLVEELRTYLENCNNETEVQLTSTCPVNQTYQFAALARDIFRVRAESRRQHYHRRSTELMISAVEMPKILEYYLCQDCFLVASALPIE